MSQDEKKGYLVVSLSKHDKIVIQDNIEIEISGRHSKANVSVRFVVRAPKEVKIKKVKITKQEVK